MKNKILPFLILFVAFGLSGTAAYYSIIGLSKLFAGVAMAVIIMASFLEASKLIIASLLYQYWNSLNKILRTYLTISLIVLILITSMGIYGMLSSGFQSTYSELSIVENKKQFIQQKIDFYEKDVTRYDKELESVLNNINTLSSAKTSQIQIRDTTSSTGYRTTVSTTELRMAQKRIEVEEQNRKQIQSKRQIASDSLQKFQLEVLELENNTEVAGELGPLKYLSGLTGTPMDKIINWLLLVIIFVFDPLAISLVIAANFAFAKAFPKKRENLYGELVDDFSEWDDLDEEETIPRPSKEEIEKMEETRDAILEKSTLYKAMDKLYPETLKKYEDLPIKVAGEEKDIKDIEVVDAEEVQPEYDILDLNKDGVVDDNEILKAKEKIKQLKEQLKYGVSAWRSNKIKAEINLLQSKLPKDDDTTKTY